MNKRRLTVENRMLIEQLLRLNYKLKDIASIIESDSSTISREIKKRRITGKGTFKECEKTKRYPFVCNGCINKAHCRKKKYYYNYIKAQNNYEYLLKNTRIGIDMTIDEIAYWNDYFKDKIKDKYKPKAVTEIFKSLRKKLGDEKFKKLFEVVLTDNGWEFSKPEDLEFDTDTGEKLINIYYCEPYSSWQKGGIERNHEFIRYIIPKGLTFDKLTKKNIVDMMNNINNVSRKSLNYDTPYNIFYKIYGAEITKKLHLKLIKKDEVNLSYKLLIK